MILADMHRSLATLDAALGQLLAALGPPELGGQAVPDETSEIDWLLNAPWAKVGLLITLAVGVLVLANVVMKGRKPERGLRARPDFDLRVAKLEALPVVGLAEAKNGPVHVEGVIRMGEGALGTGPFACVYHNRHGSGRKTAIAAELALLAEAGEGEEASVILGLENLEQARVIAPREDDGPHDTISLYLGDRVQVLGDLLLFDDPKSIGGADMRGMLGARGQIQIRVLERPERPQAPQAPSPDASANPNSDSDATPDEAPEP